MSYKRLTLHAEPYSSTGNIGENFRRLLGAPTLGPLQTVIRESVQNISDAAKLGMGPEIIIRIRTLTDDQKHAMAHSVFAELPAERDSRALIQAFLNRPEAHVMEICDFGTTGLGGPTRADQIPEGTTETDFIDFLRNVGTPRDTKHGGGTYGFGKVSLYRMSLCNTIIVDTMTTGSGFVERRLIGCHLGKAFEVPVSGMRKRYTGRYWWGTPDPDDEVVDPARGPDADSIATSLGFLPRSEGRTGTSIMILDIDTEGEELTTLGGMVGEALLWNFWPRMMKCAPPSRRFECRVEVNGQTIGLPLPEDFPPLDHFSKAMRAARSGEGNDVRNIRSQRPAAQLGRLAIETGLHAQRRRLVPPEFSIIPKNSRHIALMRPVELVVKYLEGNALPGENVEWAGVFLSSDEDEVEGAFAASEPPAHDDWIPANLPRSNGKTYVNVTLRELSRVASEMGDVKTTRSATNTSGPPLARVAAKMGIAIEGAGGDGAGQPRQVNRASGQSRPSRARVSRPEFIRLEPENEAAIAVFTTEVRQDHEHSGSILVATAGISIEGGIHKNINVQTTQPEIVSISAIDGSDATNSDSIKLNGAEGTYEVRVRMPLDCAVTVEVQMLEAE